MKVNIETEPTEGVLKSAREILEKFKGGVKITDLPKIIEETTGIKFEDLSSWTAQFVSYLVDLQRNFMGGGELDLAVFHQDVDRIFHLSKRERQYLVKNNIEEKLWAIMLVVSSSLKLNN